MDNLTNVMMRRVTPILRIFDESKAREFYLEFLEFQLDWEHRFEMHMPVYMQISNNSCMLHLSEHHGDGSPGAVVRIEVHNITKLHEKLLAKNYKYARPGLEKTPWHTIEMEITDPFGNRILFYENIE